MGWNSLRWVGWLLPVMAGCESTRSASQNVPNEVVLNHAQRGLEREARRDAPSAQSAWQTVVRRYPNTGFTDEFRDGFLDGYTECQNHGGSAQPPAALPPQFALDKKYLTPEGQGLVHDYTLGFKYGIDVAGGYRPATDGPGTPTRWSQPGAGTPDASVRAGKPSPDALLPRTGDRNTAAEPRPGSPLPKPEVPVILPFNPDLSGEKVPPLPAPPNSDLLPIPSPPLPIPGSRIEPLPPPPEETKILVPRVFEPIPVLVPPPPKTTVPTSPDEAQDAPTRPLPLILSDLPVTPYRPDPAGANPPPSKK